MRLLFLGTAADDWYVKPEQEMTELDRRRCALLLDEHILIDAAEPSFEYAKRLGVDLSAITDIVISHSHGDHFNKRGVLNYRMETSANIHIWCHAGAVDRMGFTEEEKQLFDFHPMEIGSSYCVSGYSLRPLGANHCMAAPEKAIHMVWEKEGKYLFYGCDGAWFLSETWATLKEIPFDCMIWDATFGDVWHPLFKSKIVDCGHNTISMLKMLIPFVKEHGKVKEDCVHISNHFSLLTHEDRKGTEQIFRQMGMCMAYDGMEIVI